MGNLERPSSRISDRSRDLLFIVLTCVSGTVDSLGFFGLGGIFISALSGNTVVLAASIIQGESTTTMLGISVFVGYLSGASLAAFLFKRKANNNEMGWDTQVTYILGIELIVLVLLFAQSYFHRFDSYLNVESIIMVTTASFGMGIQFICARHVNRIGVITTMITGTLSNAIYRIINREERYPSIIRKDMDNSSSLKGSNKSKTDAHKRTTIYLLTVWVGYFIGAAIMTLFLINLPLYIATTLPLALMLFIFSYARLNQKSYQKFEN
ncbi:YoaK family protein [Candidatus Nitrosocosmicus franklandus]|nr:YoaK family protein [Candidatus Nitrosocosmicus franklandus]